MSSFLAHHIRFRQEVLFALTPWNFHFKQPQRDDISDIVDPFLSPKARITNQLCGLSITQLLD